MTTQNGQCFRILIVKRKYYVDKGGKKIKGNVELSAVIFRKVSLGFFDRLRNLRDFGDHIDNCDFH